MKTIIAGSRNITDYSLVERATKECGWKITEVVSGGACGVDWLGEKWAFDNDRRMTQFRANWNEHGKSAGPIRNAKMAQYADALIAITNGSRGTENMIKQAMARGLRMHIVRVQS